MHIIRELILQLLNHYGGLWEDISGHEKRMGKGECERKKKRKREESEKGAIGKE